MSLPTLLTIAVLGLCSTSGDFREDEVQREHAAADTAGGDFGAGLFGVVGTTEEDLVLSQWGIHGELTWFVGDRLRSASCRGWAP